MLPEFLRRMVGWSLIAAATMPPLLTIVPTFAAQPASNLESREWRGLLGVAATLVRRNDFGVVVRDAAGRERHWFWEQLSSGDQAYVDEAVAADPKLRVTSPQAAAFVQVTATPQPGGGGRSDSGEGLVYHAADGRAQIYSYRAPGRTLFHDLGPVDYLATWYSPAGAKAVKLERSDMKLYDDWTVLFTGPQAELPPPMHWEDRLNAKEGDVLYLVYFSGKRQVETVVVSKVYRLPDGTVRAFEIECESARSIERGIVVADDGSTFAMVTPAPLRLEDFYIRHAVEKEGSRRRYFECVGHNDAFTTILTRTQVFCIGTRETMVEGGYEFDFTVMVAEPLGKTKSLKMLIEPGRAYESFLVEDGKWKNPTSKGKVLELRRVESYGGKHIGPLYRTPRPEHSYWTGVVTVEMQRSMAGLSYDFLVEDDTGSFRPRRGASRHSLIGAYEYRTDDAPVYDLPPLKPKSPAGP